MHGDCQRTRGTPGRSAALGFAALGLCLVVASSVRAQNCPDLPGRIALAGMVTDAASGIPLPGASVEVAWSTDGGGTLSVVADESGRFLLCGVPAETSIMAVGVMGPFRGRAVEHETSAAGGDDITVPVDLAAPANRGSVTAQAVSGPAASRILGRVVDGRFDRPVEGALVSLPAVGWQGLTDGGGNFLLGEIPPGVHEIRIESLGYETLVHELTLPEAATLQVTASIVPDPVEMEPIVATVVRYRVPEARGFYERMEWGERTGLGAFVTREEIRRMNPQRISHVVAHLPGVHLECHGRDCYPRMRRTVPTSTCRGPNLYLDGIKVWPNSLPGSAGEPIDDIVLPVEVVGIEVYRSASEIPAEYTGADARCGAILFWTSANPDG